MVKEGVQSINQTCQMNLPVQSSTDTDVVLEAVSPFNISMDFDVIVKSKGLKLPIICISTFAKSWIFSVYSSFPLCWPEERVTFSGIPVIITERVSEPSLSISEVCISRLIVPTAGSKQMSSTVRCGGSAIAWTGICITPSLVASSLIAEAPTVIFPERCCGSCNSISPKSAGLNVQTSPSNVPLLKFDPAGNVITLTTSPLDEPDIPSLADRRRGTGVSSAPPTDESVRMGGSTGGRSGEA